MNQAVAVEPELVAVPPANSPLLEIRDLRIEFGGQNESLVAVSRLSFGVAAGESYGLVG